MEAYRVEKMVEANGVLHLHALPFREGEMVEVIVLTREDKVQKSAPSPLRGTVIEYVEPTEPVAQNDWESLR